MCLAKRASFALVCLSALIVLRIICQKANYASTTKAGSETIRSSRRVLLQEETSNHDRSSNNSSDPTERNNNNDIQNSPTATVLQPSVKYLGPLLDQPLSFPLNFDDDQKHDLWMIKELYSFLPRVTIPYVQDSVDCFTTNDNGDMWNTATHMGGKMNEKLMEVGFVTYFRHHYPLRNLIFYDPKTQGLSLEHTFNHQEAVEIGNSKRLLRSALGQNVDRNDAILRADDLVLLPFCFYTKGTQKLRFDLAAEDESLRKQGKEIPKRHEWAKEGFNIASRQMQHNPRVSQLIETLTDSLDSSKQILNVVSHPNNRVGVNPLSLTNNARALRVDFTFEMSLGDLVIPQSVKQDLCPLKCPSMERTRLLFGCGAEHSVRFKNIRQDLYENIMRMRSKLVEGVTSDTSIGSLGQSTSHDHTTQVQISQQKQQNLNLNVLDSDEYIFAATQMPYDKYNEGFWTSKFCLAVLGDTVSTQQVTRAVCGGCVPVFVVPDQRELPLAQHLLDYSSFSIVVHPHEVNTDDKVLRLMQTLQRFVEDGTYERLKQNLCIARDFFNYHINMNNGNNNSSNNERSQNRQEVLGNQNSKQQNPTADIHNFRNPYVGALLELKQDQREEASHFQSFF